MAQYMPPGGRTKTEIRENSVPCVAAQRMPHGFWGALVCKLFDIRFTATFTFYDANTVYQDTYTYDLAGNRLKRVRVKTSGTETTWYRYDVRNQLAEEYTSKPGGVEEGIDYTYDLNGCQTQKSKGADITEVITNDALVSVQINDTPATETYSYNYEQRLTGYTSATVTGTYGFDDGMRRTYKHAMGGSNAGEWIYALDNADVVWESAPDFSSPTVYVNGLGIDEKKVLVRSGTAHIYLSDAQM